MSQSNGKAVPAPWMSELGIKPGEWQYMTKPQLLSLMRPCCPLKTQVWACGMLYTIGYQGEKAVKMVKICGVMKRVALTPADISRKLHEVACEYYLAADIKDDGSFKKLRDSKEAIRGVLAELENEGLADRKTLDGRSVKTLSQEQSRRLPSGKTELYFFAKPGWGNPEIATRTHEEAVRAYESSIYREKTKKNNVALTTPPHPSTSQILKLFSVEAPEPKTLKDAAYNERVAHAWEAARVIFLDKLNVAVSSLPQVGPTRLPDEPPASVLPLAPETAPQAVAASGGAFVIEGVRESVSEQSHPGRQAYSVAKTPEPARPVDAFEEKLKLFLLNSPIGIPLDDAMFQRIRQHLTEELLPQFQTEANKVKDPRKWPVYESVAKQVAARGLVAPKKTGDSPEEIIAKAKAAELASGNFDAQGRLTPLGLARMKAKKQAAS